MAKELSAVERFEQSLRGLENALFSSIDESRTLQELERAEHKALGTTGVLAQVFTTLEKLSPSTKVEFKDLVDTAVKRVEEYVRAKSHELRTQEPQSLEELVHNVNHILIEQQLLTPEARDELKMLWDDYKKYRTEELESQKRLSISIQKGYETVDAIHEKFGKGPFTVDGVQFSILKNPYSNRSELYINEAGLMGPFNPQDK